MVKSKKLEAALPKIVDLNKVRIIPNGIDLDRFKPHDQEISRKTLGLDNQTFHILVAAYPGHARKRFEFAHATAEQLKSEGLSVELHQFRNVPHSEVPIWLNLVFPPSLLCGLPFENVRRIFR